MVERLTTDVPLQREPRTGREAYVMLIDSLSAEIEEKKKILAEMKNVDVKCKFISTWHKGVRNINIYDL